MYHDIIAFVVLTEKADLLRNLFLENVCQREHRQSSLRQAHFVVDARRSRHAVLRNREQDSWLQLLDCAKNWLGPAPAGKSGHI